MGRPVLERVLEREDERTGQLTHPPTTTRGHLGGWPLGVRVSVRVSEASLDHLVEPPGIEPGSLKLFHLR